jgi:hypothetical protein
LTIPSICMDSSRMDSSVVSIFNTLFSCGGSSSPETEMRSAQRKIQQGSVRDAAECLHVVVPKRLPRSQPASLLLDQSVRSPRILVGYIAWQGKHLARLLEHAAL